MYLYLYFFFSLKRWRRLRVKADKADKKTNFFFSIFFFLLNNFDWNRLNNYEKKIPFVVYKCSDQLVEEKPCQTEEKLVTTEVIE